MLLIKINYKANSKITEHFLLVIKTIYSPVGSGSKSAKNFIVTNCT
jgi:hypothetical protein